MTTQILKDLASTLEFQTAQARMEGANITMTPASAQILASALLQAATMLEVHQIAPEMTRSHRTATM